MIKLKLIGIGLLLSLAATAQNDGIPYLSFSLNTAGEGVLVSWRVQAGNTCQDVEIWRGTDSLNLNEVYTYPGICGDDDSSKVYSYTDKPPVPGITYYYRIEIITDRTETKKIIVPPAEGISVYPNPASERLTLVSSTQNDLNELEIYDSRGNTVLKLQNPESILELDVSDWPAGAYYYRALSNGQHSTGILVVQ